MTRARTHLKLLLIGLLLIAGLAAPASADAISDKTAEAARLAKRIDELETWAEALAEQYNQATVELHQVEADLTVTMAEISAKDGESSALSLQAQEVAVRAYLYGNTTAGPVQVIEELKGSDSAPREAYLSSMLGDIADLTDQVKAVRQDANTRQKKLDTQQARKAELIATTELKRAQATKAIASSQALWPLPRATFWYS